MIANATINDGKINCENMNWKKEARVLVRAELARRDLSYKDLAKLLEGIGVSFEPKVLSNKISRGTFSFIFFLQCMHALEVESVNLCITKSIKDIS